jgi:hypothetical protein
MFANTNISLQLYRDINTFGWHPVSRMLSFNENLVLHFGWTGFILFYAGLGVAIFFVLHPFALNLEKMLEGIKP